MPTAPTAAPAPRLLRLVRQAARVHHYSLRTEEAYVGWVRRYVRYHGLRHPAELGAREVRDFLTALADRGKLSASSQTQALSALLFLYREVLGRELSDAGEVVRANSRPASRWCSRARRSGRCWIAFGAVRGWPAC